MNKAKIAIFTTGLLAAGLLLTRFESASAEPPIIQYEQCVHEDVKEGTIYLYGLVLAGQPCGTMMTAGPKHTPVDCVEYKVPLNG